MDTPTAQQLRNLFFALPATSRELSADRDLRNARVCVALGEWVTLGALTSLEVDALTAVTQGAAYRFTDADFYNTSNRQEIV